MIRERLQTAAKNFADDDGIILVGGKPVRQSGGHGGVSRMAATLGSCRRGRQLPLQLAACRPLNPPAVAKVLVQEQAVALAAHEPRDMLTSWRSNRPEESLPVYFAKQQTLIFLVCHFGFANRWRMCSANCQVGSGIPCAARVRAAPCQRH